MHNSKIAWTDHTFNPWIGCSPVSEGCEHCYAATRPRVLWGSMCDWCDVDMAAFLRAVAEVEAGGEA